MRIALLLILSATCFAQARVQYAGGTLGDLDKGLSGQVELSDGASMVFSSKKATVRVPYERINLIEYGQQVGRHLVLAVVISPAFLLAKSRKHFLTIGYSDQEGRQQAVVFRVDKNGIRSTLVGLEARTGLKVQYQDQDARKAGKG